MAADTETVRVIATDMVVEDNYWAVAAGIVAEDNRLSWVVADSSCIAERLSKLHPVVRQVDLAEPEPGRIANLEDNRFAIVGIDVGDLRSGQRLVAGCSLHRRGK